MENLFNVNQAAYILKVHPLTIRRYINEGRLKAIKAGGNIRIKESALADFNRDISEETKRPRSILRKTIISAKVFTVDDPFLRLKGRGARVQLSHT